MMDMVTVPTNGSSNNININVQKGKRKVTEINKSEDSREELRGCGNRFRRGVPYSLTSIKFRYFSSKKKER